MTSVRNVNRGRAVVLVGEPDGFCANAIGGGVDARHGIDDFAPNWGVGGLRNQDVDARFRHCSEVTAGGDAPVVDGAAVGMHGECVGKDQRRASFGCGVVNGDGDHPAERQASDMGALDAEFGEGRQDCRGIMVS